MATTIAPQTSLSGIVVERVGQREPLTVRLRSLVRGYPKGLGIIKEFLQNADDARATYLHVVMDWRSHSTHHLPDERYKELCGPALLFVNDAVFSDDDFRGIQEIGQSVKQSSPSKIGKFGLGFNAAYNVTDFPTFVSRDKLYIYDPHLSIVDDSVRDPGIGYRLTRDLWRLHPDLLGPFSAGGLDRNAISHPATIFRLPIRSAERARVSEISNEEFTAEDFDEILRHLRDSASDLLLFLQNVEALRVTVIDELGAVRTVLRVDTTNVEKVRSERGTVRRWLEGGDVASILSALRTPGSRPLSATFRHELKVQDGDDAYGAAWLVTNGIYRGPGDSLLKLAEEMSADGERALPIAGAAGRLRIAADGTVGTEPVDGRAFCGLPLPRLTGLNIHLNGYFELDANRDWLRLNAESVGRHEQQRLKWNHELLAHAVSTAAANLLVGLRDHAPGASPAELYALWPNLSDTGDTVLPGLTKATYSHLWSGGHAVVAVDPEKRVWAPAVQITVLPTHWWPHLRAPLSLAGWKVPNPELPPHVSAGFAAADHKLQELTPGQLRTKWRQKVDVNCDLAEAPNAAWRDPAHVAALLRFCLSDGSGDLIGLPLAILCDGKLHTFGLTEATVTFIGSDEQRAIFIQYPTWFVEPTFAEECRLSAVTGTKSLVVMTSSAVLLKLKRLLGSTGEPRPWEPLGEAIPNAPWLAVVLKYVGDTKALATPENLEHFKSLAVIPDQFGRLHPPGMTSTPLWPPTKSSRAVVGAALAAFRVPMVSGPKPLLKSLERALEPSDVPVVWEVTPWDLIDVLHSTIDEWGEEAGSYSSTIHEQLIDFIADQELDQLDDDRVTRLAELPIFPTRDRELVTASEHDVFLADDGKLPTPPGRGRLFMARPVSWRRLLKKAGAKVLDGSDVIEAMIEEGIGRLGTKRQHELLSWLRDNLDRILGSMEEKKGETLRLRISGAPLFPGDDGSLHAAAKLYDPSVSAARGVLGPSAVFLALDGLLADHPKLWREFCQRLGMATTLRANDIVVYVDVLIGRAAKHGVADVSESLVGVYDHVRGNWNTLGAAALQDSEHDTLAEALASRAWLPSQQRKERLRGYAAAATPEDRLYRPSELFTPSLAHLVSSQAPIAPFATPPRDVIDGLGFRTSVPVSTVIAHFERVLNVWHTEGGEKPTIEIMQTTLGAIYRDLGNRLGKETRDDQDGADADDEPGGIDTSLDEVRARFRGVPCLWDTRCQRFWPPEKTFRRCEGLGRRRASLRLTDQQQDRGYAVLGRGDEPGRDDLLDLLEEIEGESAGSPLDEEDVRAVMAVLRRLDDAPNWLSNQERNVPVLTREGHVASSSLVYDDDAGAYMSGIRPGAVHIVHHDVPRLLRAAVGIPSLAKVLHRELATRPFPATELGALRECAEIGETMRSPEFAVGLRRFIRDRQPNASMPSLAWLREVAVIAVEPFETVLSLAENGRRREVGRGPSEFHCDDERLEMYVSVDAYDVADTLIAREIERRLGLGELGDLSPLSKIVRAKPGRISALLTALSVRNIHAASGEHSDSEQGADELPMSLNEAVNEWDDRYGAEEGSENQAEVDELENAPSVRASGDAKVGTEDAEDDAGAAGENAAIANWDDGRGEGPDDAAASGVEDAQEIPRVNHLRGGERPPRYGVSDSTSPRDEVSSSRTASPLDGRSPDGTDRTGGVRPDRGQPDPRQVHSAGGSATGAVGVPNPEARRSGTYENDSGDGFQSPRGAGEARTSGRSGHQGPSRRVVTYIVSQAGVETVESDAGDDESLANMAVGRAAEEFVEVEESRTGRLAERRPHNNPGYDIYSVGADPGDIRYIEVKGVSGEWGAGGVPLSARQFEMAWHERDKFWLYVVEFAQDPERRRVTRLQNPVGKVTQYRVDSGWRSLGFATEAELSGQEARPAQPATGDLVTLADGRSGTILEVRGAGMLVQLSIQLSDGAVESTLFKPDRMTVIKRVEG
jgi:sacsin